jgi:carboxyl-terminal processing protease
MWSTITAICALSSGALAQEAIEGLDQALAQVHAHFPEVVTTDALYHAALQGMVNHLGDVMGAQVNRVMSPAEYANIETWMAGHRSGFGAEFGIVAGRGMVLTDVFPNGPADHAGMQPGDLIISMDEHPFTGLSETRIHARIQASVGSLSVFDVRRADGTLHRVSIERGPYQVPLLRHRVLNDVLVVRIPFFATGTAEALAETLHTVESFSAVVLDLRDNDGGLLAESVASADQFLDPGAIIIRLNHDEQETQLTGPSVASWTGPVVVLINRGTSGVAEALAASLRDHHRATILGTRSAGQGIQTSHFPAGRGFVLEIADTHLGPPTGKSWHSVGVVPDITVEAQPLSIPDPSSPLIPDLQRDAALRLISMTGG